MSHRTRFPHFWQRPTALALLALLYFWPGTAFSKAQDLRYADQTYTLYINPAKVLFLIGPWGDDPVVVDRPVRNVWGIAASFGIAAVYEKRDELHWAVLDREDGKSLAGGILQQLSPEEGDIETVEVTLQDTEALAKVVFEDGHFTVYQFDRQGQEKLVRQGKAEKP